MYVELLNLSGIDVAEQAAWVCRNPSMLDDEHRADARRILLNCIKNGHLSVTEHITASFYISGISRACSHQLVRHRIASYTQTSQRFENSPWEKADVLPESIYTNELRGEYEEAIEKARDVFVRLIENGVPQEDARFVLPNAMATTLVMTINFRSLMNFLNLRMCMKAQWEIRELAELMQREISYVDQELACFLLPACDTCKDKPACRDLN